MFLFAQAGLITNPATAADLQNFLLCVEMAIAAVGHKWAFPHSDFANAPGVAGGLGGSITHAIAINDVVSVSSVDNPLPSVSTRALNHWRVTQDEVCACAQSRFISALIHLMADAFICGAD